MKIPNNKILAAGALIGGILTTISSYWIGRRDELDQIIDLGRDTEDETGFRVLDMLDSKNRQSVSLFIKTQEK